MSPAKHATVIGVVGASGAGKTTLLEQLLRSLRARGFAVGAVKHASHGFEADRPGKDSQRLYGAGAAAVALVSNEQVATFVRRGGGELRLAEALAALPPDLDLVLVEGFSWEPIPRIVITTPSDARLGQQLWSGEPIAVLASPRAADGAPPRFGSRQLADLVDAIAARALRCPDAPPPNGRPLRHDASLA